MTKELEPIHRLSSIFTRLVALRTQIRQCRDVDPDNEELSGLKVVVEALIEDFRGELQARLNPETFVAVVPLEERSADLLDVDDEYFVDEEGHEEGYED